MNGRGYGVDMTNPADHAPASDPSDTARENQWNAYRWPTAEELDSGLSERDVVWVGCAPSEKEAMRLLPKKEGLHVGQIQWGKGGPVLTL